MSRDIFKMNTAFRIIPQNTFHYKQIARYGGVGGYGGLADIVHNTHFLWARGLCPPTICDAFSSFTTTNSSEQSNPDLVYIVKAFSDLSRYRVYIDGSFSHGRLKTKYGGTNFTWTAHLTGFMDGVIDHTKDDPTSEYEMVKVWFWDGGGSVRVYNILGTYAGENHIYSTADLSYDSDIIPIDERQCGITKNAVDVEAVNTVAANLSHLQKHRTPMIFTRCDPSSAKTRYHIDSNSGLYIQSGQGGYSSHLKVPVRPMPGCTKIKVWFWAFKTSGTANYIWARTGYNKTGWKTLVSSTAAFNANNEPDGLYDGSGETLDIPDDKPTVVEILGQSDGDLYIPGVYIHYCDRD